MLCAVTLHQCLEDKCTFCLVFYFCRFFHLFQDDLLNILYIYSPLVYICSPVCRQFSVLNSLSSSASWRSPRGASVQAQPHQPDGECDRVSADGVRRGGKTSAPTLLVQRQPASSPNVRYMVTFLHVSQKVSPPRSKLPVRFKSQQEIKFKIKLLNIVLRMHDNFFQMLHLLFYFPSL